MEDTIILFGDLDITPMILISFRDIMVQDFTVQVTMALDSTEIHITIEGSTGIMDMAMVLDLMPLFMEALDGTILTIIIIQDNITSDEMWLTLLGDEEKQAIIAKERMLLEMLLV